MTSDISKVRLLRLAHVHYRHVDMIKAHEFLQDFGLTKVEQSGSRIYYRGYGSDPYCYVAESGERGFAGGAFIVESFGELEKASKLPGASKIENAQGPGGGSCVYLKDPNDQGITLLYGQKNTTPTMYPSTSRYNTAQNKERVGVFHRYEPGPSSIHKLGHYGFLIPKEQFNGTIKWYSETFNLTMTDSVYDPETGADETCFLHFDLGETYVDHHGVFFTSAFGATTAHVHHASFEVHDMDMQTMGHDWLQSRGWTNCWGVGRHYLGSQIFDYWFDASGFIIEHYSDGDLVNSKSIVSRDAAAPKSLYVWGPNVPQAFLTTNIEDVVKMVPNVEKGTLEPVASA